MRRVLLVGDYPPPFGGLSVQVAALRRRLAARGDSTVQVLDIGARRRETRPDCLPVTGGLDFVGKVRAHARDGFTIHLHTNGHNPKSWVVALVCAAAGLRHGRRTLISLGSGRMAQFVAEASTPVRAIARATVRAAGAVIVRNAVARAAAIGLGATPDKVRILPGFYGVAAADVGVVPFEAVRFRRGHRPLIGAIASRGPEYGVTLLVDAAARVRARHPELGLVLIGPEPMEHGCPVWALELGERDRPALLAVMRTLDVFVRPTYFDGDASSVREAQALGVRVVASNTDFRPEGVTVFKAGDADGLAEAIETSLGQDPVRSDSTSLPVLLDLYDALPLDGARRLDPAPPVDHARRLGRAIPHGDAVPHGDALPLGRAIPRRGVAPEGPPEDRSGRAPLGDGWSEDRRGAPPATGPAAAPPPEGNRVTAAAPPPEGNRVAERDRAAEGDRVA